MRKISVLISTVCIISILATPFPLTGQDGVYNTISHLYWCNNPSACTHEIGHKLDQESGWTSSSPEFGDAIKTFILAESRSKNPSPFLYKLFAQPDFSWKELYADIFQWSDGDMNKMPEVFRKFYDWPRARELMGE